jgi:uncharacterized membrane protein
MAPLENKTLNTIKWILLASLLANAVFAGFVFSQVTNRFGLGFGPRPGVMREVARPREVSEQTRAVLDKVFASEKGDMEQAVKAWVASRRKTVQVLRAEPLDKAALDLALADMRAKTVAAQEVYHRVVSQAAPELSAEERVLLARILNAGPNRFGTGAVLDTPGGPRPGDPRGGPGGRGPGDNRTMPPPEGSAGEPEAMGPPPPPKP